LPGPASYTLLNEENAKQIARDWNARDPPEKTGCVTGFRVKTAFLAKDQRQTAGRRIHQKYWIPAGDLAEFDANIVGF